MIVERFISFIQSDEITGEGLSTEILNGIEVDKLDIHNVWGNGLTTVPIWLVNKRE